MRADAITPFVRDSSLVPRTRPQVLNQIFTSGRRFGLDLAGIEAGLLLRLAGLDVERVVDTIEALGERGHELTIESLTQTLSREAARESAAARPSRGQGWTR